MKAWAVLAILGASAQPGFAQTVVVGDAYVSGSMGVGTSTPTARLQVVGSSTAGTFFQVSGVDETPFLNVASSGAAGVGVAPAAQLDINGSADSGVVGLQLRNGNMYGATGAYQLTFGSNGSTNLRHAIRTIHSTTTANSSIDFLLWSQGASTTSVGSLEVLSLVTTSTEACFHIMPMSVALSTPNVEVVVSNGSMQGEGTVIRAVEAVESSREIKSDITYLGPGDEERAYQEEAGLRHAEYRYKSWKKGKLIRDKKQPIRRGLIYEDTPASIRGPGETLVFDERINNAEMAMKALIQKLEKSETDAGGLK